MFSEVFCIKYIQKFFVSNLFRMFLYQSFQKFFTYQTPGIRSNFDNSPDALAILYKFSNKDSVFLISGKYVNTLFDTAKAYKVHRYPQWWISDYAEFGTGLTTTESVGEEKYHQRGWSKASATMKLLFNKPK